jgi:hypothetical protein
MWNVERNEATQLRRLRTLLIAAVAGAAAMFFLEPRSGRRRRALARDKARHYARLVPSAFGRLGRRMAGPMHGAAHEAAARMHWYVAPPVPDRDQFIKERVESELGHARELPLSALNFDAADGVVRVRGTVPDAATAQDIIARVAKVTGVRAAESRMQTPDGTPIRSIAGDAQAVAGAPRAVVYGQAMRRALQERWPTLTDDDIEASAGHIGRLVIIICERSGDPEREVRQALDAMVEVVV